MILIIAKRCLLAALVVVLGLGAGCASGSEPVQPAGPMSGTRSFDQPNERDADGPDGPTFYEDVAPILNDHCVYCHHEGGLGPFPLVRYQEAVDVGPLIASAVSERRMPPMPVNNDGSCNTYANARWLSDEQIGVLVDWYATGMAEGDVGNAPAPADRAVGLDGLTHVLDMGVTYTPDGLVDDDYRCFVIDAMADTELVVTGYEVMPGEPRVVHHAIVYMPSTQAGADRLDALEAGDSRPGYNCYGGPGVDATPLMLWAPGGGAIHYPEGTGLSVPAGRRLVLQIHYNLEAGPLPDRTKIHVATKPSVPSPARLRLFADRAMQLSPREPYVETSAEIPLDFAAGRSVKVYGALPHMHELGRTLRLELMRETKSDQCIVDVDRWEFTWQGAWFYDTPIPVDIEATDKLRITCGYDTRERNEVVTWGEGTRDEMCLTYLYLTVEQ